ncbi:MAG: DUF4438 domain-containing protein [Acidimicrobiales bacterium]
MSEVKVVSVNLLGYVDQGEVGTDPYRVDRDGRPYVAVGDGGTVLGLRLGDSVFDHVGDHAAPGVCLVHPNQEACHALVGLACLGNQVIVRTGDAAGRAGAVLGKRGGGQRVIAVFSQDVLTRLRPGDQVALASCGQGAAAPLPGLTQMNIAPAALSLLGVTVRGGHLEVGVRAMLPSPFVGNGIGRPMIMWDVDLQVDADAEATRSLRLGDLVAISDLDARANAGYRRDWMSVGIVVHGASPQPGHGPGVTIVLSGPAERFSIRVEGDTHTGLSEKRLISMAEEEGREDG